MYIQLEKDIQNKYLELIRNNAEQNTLKAVRYLDLGPSVIRVFCYTAEIIPILEKQFTYVLRENMEHYDSTIAVYKEKNAAGLSQTIYQSLPVRQKMKIKAEMLMCNLEYPVIQVADEKGGDILIVDGIFGLEQAYDENSKTYYYGVGNLDQEDFIRFGHCFKPILYRLVNSKTVHMTHGAVMGYKGKGFLLCGRGKRGKSTLTVHSMLNGFEYVSDDFQILEKTTDKLLSFPVYSVITLSHQMYNEMYNSFKGKFVCNNYEKDKYIFNIADYHDQFRSAYPISFCLFPEITADKKPSIQLCKAEEKGRAMVHILHSTAFQMHALIDAEALRDSFNMLKKLPFYKINLCSDISANTEYLRNFLETENILDTDDQPLPRILKDISFSLATFLDTNDFKFYSLNKFATDVYSLLSNEVPASTLSLQLEKYAIYNADIMKEFEALQNLIGFLGPYDGCNDDCSNLKEDLAEKSGYHLSISN